MRLIVLALLVVAASASAQSTRVLHFTRTSGYDHNTRAVSNAMLQSIAVLMDISVDDDATGDPFNSLAALGQYSAIIFANTSGNAILDAQQRANFEQWVANGGHVMGIHAASDTYRHSTANGGSTGAWDFYPELIGGSVQENPNHVSGTPEYAMEHVTPHPSLVVLPDPWVKNEEYYYWEGGYYDPGNVELLRVEETIGPNGLVNSYDAPRPMCWVRMLPNGSRVFYTALGHAQSNYTADITFMLHIMDGLKWLLGIDFGSVNDRSGGQPVAVNPNPAADAVVIVAREALIGERFAFLDATGRILRQGRISAARMTVPVAEFPAGSYVLKVGAAAVRLQVSR